MNLKGLRAFLHVVDEGSLAAAARRLHLSPPAVSRLVQQLETELGATLFYRDRTRLAPTPEGERFYPEARRVVTSIDDFPALFAQIRDERLVPLRVLCQLRVAEGLVVPALAEFGRRHPDVRFTLDIHPRRELARRMTRDTFDIGVYVVPLESAGTRLIATRRTPLQVLLPKDHALAGRRRLRPKDLVGERYIALRRGLMGREAIDRALADAGERLEVFHEVSSTGAAHGLVAAGLGFTFSDPTVLSPDIRRRTALVAWQPTTSLEIGVFAPREDTHEAADAFVACLDTLWSERTGESVPS